jgi:hypothetical protein
MPANDYSDGIDGAGQKWKDRVDTEQSQDAYEGGATGDASDDYETNAGNAGDEYAAGIADYLGVDENDIDVDGDYESGVSGAGSAWQSGVQASGERWRNGVQGADASEYEENAKAASNAWFENYKKGVGADD